MNLFNYIGQTWSQYRAFRSTYTELSQLSDAELKDMGLYRGDIVRIAYDAAESGLKVAKPANSQGSAKAARTCGVLRESH